MTSTDKVAGKSASSHERANQDHRGGKSSASARVVLMSQNDDHANAARSHGTTAGERRAHGRACGRRCPRGSCRLEGAEGAARSDRAVGASNEGRVIELIPIRFGRMMQSPFTFYRGSAGVMAADLATTRAIGIACAGVRRRASAELRRFRHARAQCRLRHQRSRRDAAGAVGMGRQASGRERGHRRTISPAERDRARPRGRGDGAVVSRAHGRLLLEAGARGLVRDHRHRRRAGYVQRGGESSPRAVEGKRVEEAQEKSTPEFVFPKLVEHRGRRAAVQGRTAADLPSRRRNRRRGSRGLPGAAGRLSRRRCPTMSACSSTAIIFATSR